MARPAPARGICAALAALAVSCALLSLVGCATPPPTPCSEVNPIVYMEDAAGAYLISDEIVRKAYGIDRRDCLQAR